MLTIIGDPHFGLKRSAGATPESMAAFAEWQLRIFREALGEATSPVLIVGDLFSHSIVPYEVILDVMSAIASCPQEVVVLKGNHDITKDRSQMCSLDFLYRIWQHNLRVISAPTVLFGCALVPHMVNQDAFDNAVAWAAKESDTLITHANFNNGFAEGKDHSLNLTKEQADLFKTVIIGHEHNASVRGNVTAVGSMVPCNPGEAEPKWSWKLDDAGHVSMLRGLTGCLKLLEVVHWQGLAVFPTVAESFIKVIGTAAADEANVVLKEIGAFRKRSGAYMLQNAVKVGKIDLGNLEQEAQGDLEKFDALAELLAMLEDKDVETLRGLGLV